jgi:hypothetical protein
MLVPLSKIEHQPSGGAHADEKHIISWTITHDQLSLVVQNGVDDTISIRNELSNRSCSHLYRGGHCKAQHAHRCSLSQGGMFAIYTPHDVVTYSCLVHGRRPPVLREPSFRNRGCRLPFANFFQPWARQGSKRLCLSHRSRYVRVNSSISHGPHPLKRVYAGSF